MSFQRMALYLVTLLALLQFYSASGSEAAHPRVCLNMIVKDESKVIERCLASTLPMIDYWVIVDTGSSDGTQEVIRSYMKKMGVPGELHERPWVNFCHNRNEAYGLAKEKGDYILFLDADESFTYEEGFALPRLDKDYYFIEILYSGLKYVRTALVKSALNWEWKGVVHEVICSNEAMSWETLPRVKNIIVQREGVRSRDSEIYSKDAELLKEAVERDPSDTRSLFYLAQSYFDAGNFPLAKEAYEKRAEMGGFSEEVYWSLFRIGDIMERLDYPFEEVVNQYQRAYGYRPTRYEALYQLARAYRLKGDYDKGYALCQIAKNQPQCTDLLFVCQWMEDYGFILEESVCAYWLGNYRKAQELSQKMLAKSSLPPHVRSCVERNLQFANRQLVEEICSQKQITAVPEKFSNLEAKSEVNPAGEENSSLPSKLSKLLLVTGCARSGTGYIAKVLSRSGLNICHEELGCDGCSSWPLAVDDSYSPWGVSGSNVEFAHILHQVRNPLQVINSVCSTEPARSWEYIAKHIPEIDLREPLLLRAAKYWYYWNKKAEEKAEFTYRVEDIANAIGKIGDTIGVKLDENGYKRVSTFENSRAHDVEISWGDLVEAVPKELLDNIRSLALHYGYSEEELMRPPNRKVRIVTQSTRPY